MTKHELNPDFAVDKSPDEAQGLARWLAPSPHEGRVGVVAASAALGSIRRQ